MGLYWGLDAYLYVNEENLLSDQIYPLPEKYHRPNYSLEYKNLLRVALTLFVYADETFKVETFTTQWDRVESISLDKGTFYVYYQQYEDGKEYPRGVLCDYPGAPGYVMLSKHDLLCEVSTEEMRNLIVNSLDALQNLPSFFERVGFISHFNWEVSDEILLYRASAMCAHPSGGMLLSPVHHDDA